MIESVFMGNRVMCEEQDKFMNFIYRQNKLEVEKSCLSWGSCIVTVINLFKVQKDFKSVP